LARGKAKSARTIWKWKGAEKTHKGGKNAQDHPRRAFAPRSFRCFLWGSPCFFPIFLDDLRVSPKAHLLYYMSLTNENVGNVINLCFLIPFSPFPWRLRRSHQGRACIAWGERSDAQRSAGAYQESGDGRQETDENRSGCQSSFSGGNAAAD
jgi:hypothetical protein